MRSFQVLLATIASCTFTRTLAFVPQGQLQQGLLPNIITQQSKYNRKYSYHSQTFNIIFGIVHNKHKSARFSFFKNLIDKAFENDDSLISSQDKRKGQLEGPNDYDSSDDNVLLVTSVIESSKKQQQTLTPTQEKWRQQQQQQSLAAAETSNQGVTLANKAFSMDFYLSGIPNKDPSNDLYGSRVNISSRDKSLGLLYVPETPTVSDVCIQFYGDDNSKKCKCQTDTPFTKVDEEGDWIMSNEGNSNNNKNNKNNRRQQVRFRIPVTGYTRTVETKGSIQSIYWSSEPEKQLQTSTVYSIPAGWLYGEATITASANAKSIQWQDGVLKIEQATGFLGAGTKMVPCGKFTAKQIQEDEVNK